MRRLISKSRLPLRQVVTIGLLPSALKKAVYRLKGYKIGKNVSLGLGSVIVGKEVEIGDGASVGFLSLVRARKIRIGRFVKIGATSIIDTEEVEIGDDTRINEQVFIGGLATPESRITIGKRAIIMQLSFINPTMPIVIGDDTGIGGHCLLFTHGSWLSQLDGFPVQFAPITLGNNVWLPWRVFIMPGVHVGDNVVIGADSLVAKDIPSNALAAGSPAKVLKESYPPPLTETRRGEILASILDGFRAHLSYHGMAVEEEPLEDGLVIRVRAGKAGPRSLYLERRPTRDLPEDAELLVIDHETDEESRRRREIPMMIDLRSKVRRGTSELGEEFVAFLSRFGVRFDRLD